MSDINNGNGIELREMSLEDAPLKWLLNTNDLSDTGRIGKITAEPDELRALTKLLNDEHDLEVTSFTCAYDIKPQKIAAVRTARSEHVEGCHGRFELRAELRQTCVVSLERIDTLVVEEFSQTFTSEAGRRLATDPAEEEFDELFAQDPPLTLVKGRIVLGPLAYQYLSMAIDCNPRKTDVQFEEERARTDEPNDRPPSPFVVLKDYKHSK